MPKLVYLDSSDFSDLSSPSLSEDSRIVLEALRKGHTDGTALYYFSLIHLSEAVHANTAYKESAVRRARLIAELCGSNALRFPNDIFSLELRKVLSGATHGRLSLSELLSPPSEWFGFRLGPDLHNWRKKIDIEFDKRIAHLPRHERRKVKSQMPFSKKSGREQWRTLYDSMPPHSLTEFPFDLLDRDFVIRWMLREKTDQEFSEQLTRILSNPTSMIQHVLDSTGERATIYEIVRNEGHEIQQAMEIRLRTYIDRLMNIIGPEATTLPMAKLFREAIPKALLYRSVIEGYSDRNVPELSDNRVVSTIRMCPALSVFAKLYINFAYSLFESNWQRRKHGVPDVIAGKPSDFGDLMHAAYAPYMDLFRCDKYFGSLLRQDPSVSARIVTRRASLTGLLQPHANEIKAAS
jgi:hypothetical protein